MESDINNPNNALKEQVGGDYYKKMAIQPMEYVHKNGIGYIAGSAIKYVSRYKFKNGKQDLEKAIHCIKMLLALEYPDINQITQKGNHDDSTSHTQGSD